jgi:hypothetical protein
VATTPIFDLIETPPKVPQTKWIVYLIAGLVGVMLGISPNMNLRYFTGFNGFLILPALYVTVAIHELGHLVAGRTVGMRPGAIMIGGVVIFKSGAHWVIRFDYRWMFSGGLAKLLPQKGDFRPASFGWAIAGGPIASLMFTVVWGLVALRYGNGLWGSIATLFWTALFITVLALVSFSRGKSDGARLWKLMRRPDTTMDGIVGTAGRRNLRGTAP